MERRARPAAEGLDRLCAELAARREEPAPALAAGVLRALHDAAHADDECLLLARMRAA